MYILSEILRQKGKGDEMGLYGQGWRKEKEVAKRCLLISGVIGVNIVIEEL